MAQVKIDSYENFVDTRLKPDLVLAMAMRDKVFAKEKEFTDLATNIRMLQQQGLRKFESMVNLGSEIYVQAEVPDTSRIFVEVGLGFFAEFTLDEALTYIDSKKTDLKGEADVRTRDVARIKAQIKLVMEGIRELMNLPAEK